MNKIIAISLVSLILFALFAIYLIISRNRGNKPSNVKTALLLNQFHDLETFHTGGSDQYLNLEILDERNMYNLYAVAINGYLRRHELHMRRCLSAGLMMHHYLSLTSMLRDVKLSDILLHGYVDRPCLSFANHTAQIIVPQDIDYHDIGFFNDETTYRTFGTMDHIEVASNQYKSKLFSGCISDGTSVLMDEETMILRNAYPVDPMSIRGTKLSRYTSSQFVNSLLYRLISARQDIINVPQTIVIIKIRDLIDSKTFMKFKYDTRKVMGNFRHATIIIDVDSNGGSYMYAIKIDRIIRKLKKQNVGIIMYISSRAWSGGYYISAQKRYVYASHDSIIGGMGTIVYTVAHKNIIRAIKKNMKDFT